MERAYLSIAKELDVLELNTEGQVMVLDSYNWLPGGFVKLDGCVIFGVVAQAKAKQEDLFIVYCVVHDEDLSYYEGECHTSSSSFCLSMKV